MPKLVSLLLFNVLQGTILFIVRISQNKCGIVIYISAKQTVFTPQYALYGED